jgi:hypothetical protein
MPKPKATILRLTVNVDLANMAELAFIRAFCARLNVLYAKTSPKSDLENVLGGRKLREHLEDSRKRQIEYVKAHGGAVVEPGATFDKSDKTSVISTQKSEAESQRQTQQSGPTWGKGKLRVISIFERTMELLSGNAPVGKVEQQSEKRSTEKSENFLDNGDFL